MDREAASKLLEGPGETEVYYPADGAKLREDREAAKALAAVILTPDEALDVRRRDTPAKRAVHERWQAAVQSLLEPASVRRYNQAVEIYRKLKERTT